MRGRPPKPTSLKLVTGNPGKRAVNKQEPDPEYLTNLAAPDWLPPASAKVWDEVVPHLRAAKLLTNIDVNMLAMGCNAVAQYRSAAMKASQKPIIPAKKSKDASGKTVTTGSDYVSPWLMIQSMAFKQAMTVFQQFGMSPAARTRIAVNPQGELFGDEPAKTGTDRYFDS